MTLFDIVALTILFVSAVAGFFRGAMREMVTVLALILAALASLFALRYAGPLGRGLIDPDWAGNVAAILVVFVLVYIVLRLIGGSLAARVQATEVLGMLDRTIGVAFGLIRALVVLGAFSLMFHAVTPPERVPNWMSDAALYPLTTNAGEVLKAAAPQGLDMAGRLRPALEGAVRNGSGESGAEPAYDAGERSGLDDLVERSR